jgi:hypothetical protein
MSAMFRSVVSRYGLLPLAAYGVFVVASLTVDALTVELLGAQQGRPLFDIARMLEAIGGSGDAVRPMLLLGYLSILGPGLWPDRRAWLLLLLPLCAVLAGFWTIRDALGGLGPMSEILTYGPGLYLSLLSAATLAALALVRFLTAGTATTGEKRDPS